MADRSGRSDSSIGSITRGASFYAIGRVVSKATGFFVNLILTRTLGTGLYGIYAYGTTILSFVAVFTDLGTDKALLKFIPEYEGQPHEQDEVIGLVAVTVIAASVPVSGLLYVFAPLINGLTLQRPLFVDALRIFAIALPFKALATSIVHAFKGLELPKYQILVSDIAMSISRLVFITLAVLLGYALLGAIAAIVLAWIITFAIGVVLFLSRTSLRVTLTTAKSKIIKFYNFSIPLTVERLGSILQNRTDVLMVGFFLSSSAVGVYNVAILLAGFLQIPLIAFNQLFPSVASRLYANGEFEELQAVYSQLTRWTLTITLVPTLGLVLYPSEVLAVFGQNFATGAEVLVLFALGQFVYAAVGSSGYLLMMTEHQYLAMANQWGMGILNVILNYFFIQYFGIIGAALASAGLIVVINVLTVLEVWYIEGLFPYSWDFLKPLFAGGVAGVTMYLLSGVFSGFILLIVGGGCGALTFVLTLLVLGIEQVDKEFFREYVSSDRLS
jgi:O-antigen/teichoic acid export membrane protein